MLPGLLYTDLNTLETTQGFVSKQIFCSKLLNRVKTLHFLSSVKGLLFYAFYLDFQLYTY